MPITIMSRPAKTTQPVQNPLEAISFSLLAVINSVSHAGLNAAAPGSVHACLLSLSLSAVAGFV
jgi:hypothetical protein